MIQDPEPVQGSNSQAAGNPEEENADFLNARLWVDPYFLILRRLQL